MSSYYVPCFYIINFVVIPAYIDLPYLHQVSLPCSFLLFHCNNHNVMCFPRYCAFSYVFRDIVFSFRLFVPRFVDFIY